MGVFWFVKNRPSEKFFFIAPQNSTLPDFASTYNKPKIKEALRSSLDGMVKWVVSHALVAHLSGSIYAADHKAKIEKAYHALLGALLNEPVGPQARGHYFKQEILATIP